MTAAFPPVPASAPLADARVAEILAACRKVFAEKGFDRASMQDLARAAGMSAGNFYRYFASKDAIVEAMVAHDMAGIETQFAQVMGSDDPRTTLGERLMMHLDLHDADESAIWCEIMAEARRKPVIGAMYEALNQRIRDYLVAAFARIAGTPHEVAARRFGGHAEMLMLLLQGVRLRRSHGDAFAGSQLRALVRRSMTRLLDEVFQSLASDSPDAARPPTVPPPTVPPRTAPFRSAVEAATPGEPRPEARRPGDARPAGQPHSPAGRAQAPGREPPHA